MIEIIVYLKGSERLLHNAQHLAATIREIETGEFAIVDYAKENDQLHLTVRPAYEWSRLYFNAVDYKPLSLLSPSGKRLNEFITSYNSLFLQGECRMAHNCSHAVDFALNYFFEVKKSSGFFKTLKNLFCCCLCAVSCGCKCFRAPIKTPHEVFKKATKIQKKSSVSICTVSTEIALPVIAIAPKI